MGYLTYFEGFFEADRPFSKKRQEQLQNYQDGTIELPKNAPDEWNPWTVKDGTKLIGVEERSKVYDYVAWLNYIIGICDRRGYILNGTVFWFGEDEDDRGKLVIEDYMML